MPPLGFSAARNRLPARELTSAPRNSTVSGTPRRALGVHNLVVVRSRRQPVRWLVALFAMVLATGSLSAAGTFRCLTQECADACAAKAKGCCQSATEIQKHKCGCSVGEANPAPAGALGVAASPLTPEIPAAAPEPEQPVLPVARSRQIEAGSPPGAVDIRPQHPDSGRAPPYVA